MFLWGLAVHSTVLTTSPPENWELYSLVLLNQGHHLALSGFNPQRGTAGGTSAGNSEMVPKSTRMRKETPKMRKGRMAGTRGDATVTELQVKIVRGPVPMQVGGPDSVRSTKLQQELAELSLGCVETCPVHRILKEPARARGWPQVVSDVAVQGVGVDDQAKVREHHSLLQQNFERRCGKEVAKKPQAPQLGTAAKRRQQVMQLGVCQPAFHEVQVEK